MSPYRFLVMLPLLAACRPSPITRDVMWTHFFRVTEMESAVIDGDLARAKTVSGAIASSDSIPGIPPEGRPFEVALKDQARIGATAPDLPAAGHSVASIGMSCGNCHRALNRGPKFPPGARPAPSDQPVSQAMILHRWGMDQLWYGLIGPSDFAWRQGATAMQDEATYAELIRPNVPRGDAMRAMAAAVKQMGQRGQNENDPVQRAILYGRMLTTCTGCHEMAGVK